MLYLYRSNSHVIGYTAAESKEKAQAVVVTRDGGDKRQTPPLRTALL